MWRWCVVLTLVMHNLQINQVKGTAYGSQTLFLRINDLPRESFSVKEGLIYRGQKGEHMH